MITGKVAGTIITALATSYYAYRTTKVEAESKVALAKVQAEAGYSTLADAVGQLTAAAEQNRKLLDDERLYSAKLEGRILSIEGLIHSGVTSIRQTPTHRDRDSSGGLADIGGSSGRGFGTGSGGAARSAPTIVVRPANLPAPPPLPKKLPPTLDEATVQVQQIQMQKAAKK